MSVGSEFQRIDAATGSTVYFIQTINMHINIIPEEELGLKQPQYSSNTLKHVSYTSLVSWH